MAEAKKKITKTKAKTEEPVEALVDKVVETETVTEKKTTAKAGKRSEKGLKAAEEKVAKQERKAQIETTKEETTEPKKSTKPARSRLERRSKLYREAASLIDSDKSYSLVEALELATKTSKVKFDASVELHARLGVDPRQADQNIRQTVTLPAGTGKSVRIAVFADVDDVAKAKKAGADIAGGDEFLQQLDKGTIDFDVLIATPSMMPKLGKYARVLGPKGLMPNPKSGTVSADVTKAVTEAKAGRIEYRVDSTGIIHTNIGKVSFGKERLNENARAILDSVKAAKPASVKATYVQSVFVTTTMGPSIPVALSDV